MINNHDISISVNGKMVDIFDKASLNVRLNSTIFDPSKITDTQAEYSFTFSLPITKSNAVIFDYAHAIAKDGKFVNTFPCTVYADGIDIFNGKIKVKEISNNEYKVNLVSPKINKVDDIFKEDTMDSLRWTVPYEGAQTINKVNADTTSKYFFPLVCYGTFQKKPITTYSNNINAYTSKYQLDNTNLWYEETFAPSLNLNETIKRMFKQRGYEVTGDAFDDDTINSIYFSENLKDGQDPLYNFGGPLGKASCAIAFTNIKESSTSTSWERKTAPYLENDLQYKTDPTGGDNYNYETAAVYDIWAQKDTDFLSSKVIDGSKQIWRDNCFVAPADGIYYIEMNGTMDITRAPETFEIMKYKAAYGDEMEKTTIKKSWDSYPLELQLVRNTDTIELIRPINLNSVYPHEAPPSTSTGIGKTTTSNFNKGNHGSFGGNGRYNRNTTTQQGNAQQTDSNGGFIPTNTLAYDQYASKNFICGAASFQNTPSFMKRGYSWNDTMAEYVNSRYNCSGYKSRKIQNGETTDTNTDYNYCTMSEPIQFPEYIMNVQDTIVPYMKQFSVSGLIELKKNDVLTLKCVARYYNEPEFDKTNPRNKRPAIYPFDITCSVSITAAYPKVSRIAQPLTTPYVKSEFDTDLNLGNFLSKETKCSDFVNEYLKLFNLQYSQTDEKSINISKRKLNDFIKVPINIDDRTNNKNATILPVDYPSSMSVQFSIDEEEAGFYYSVPEEYINDEDWKEHADKGYDIIKYTNNPEGDEQTVSLNTSYCWYHDFKIYPTNEQGEQSDTEAIIHLPIISKDEWMIDNYKMEESMKHDGKGLHTRLWYRNTEPSGYTVYTTNKQPINLYIPLNKRESLPHLDYKETHESLLTNYYNIRQNNDSNLVEIEAYLTPDEYKRLKLSATVAFDRDIYDICSMTGYDPTGGNTTKLTLIKRT